MRFSQSKEGDVLVIALRGRMSVGDGDAEAGDPVGGRRRREKDPARHERRAGARLVGSGGADGGLHQRRRSRHGGTIKLLGLSPRVGEVLKITRLVGIFDIYDDRIEAIESFS